MDVILPLETIGAFLNQHPPQLSDILAASCELYRADPDDIGLNQHSRTEPACDMFIYCARKFAGRTYQHAGGLVGIHPSEASRRMQRFVQRLGIVDSVLRDDLDLMAIRLTECVLRRRRCR